MVFEKTPIFFMVVLVLVSLDLCFGSELGVSPAHGDHGHHHHCDHGHGHDHHHHQRHVEEEEKKKMMLPEELAEEEDMKLYGFGPYLDDHDHDHDHDHHHQDLSSLASVTCSQKVNSEGLVCSRFNQMLSGIPPCFSSYCEGKLALAPYTYPFIWPLVTRIGLFALSKLGFSCLPDYFTRDIYSKFDNVIAVQGKPSKAVVDSLALFGAGAMLGDAFLHQLPHSFGGAHSHSHDDHEDHAHHTHTGHDNTHAHSLKDLSVGLSVLVELELNSDKLSLFLSDEDRDCGYKYSVRALALSGIVLFLIVEKLVRYVEENSGGASGWSHGHHHHHHKSNKNLRKKDEDAAHRNSLQPVGDTPDNSLNADNATQPEIRKRKSSAGTNDGKSDTGFADGSANSVKTSALKETSHSQSNLVFGYLNLFSDGVHNFTDGMALGSAFLLHGSVGGWSRTLFLLAHELPQEALARLIALNCSLRCSQINGFSDPSKVGTSNFVYLGTTPIGRTTSPHGGGVAPPLTVGGKGAWCSQVGDFGILVRSGFSVSKALFFNFLSALVALAGTAMALLWGQDPGQSSLIEGFTAGGFIYIAVAGVLAEMNNYGKTTLKNTAVQLLSLASGMAVALCISLVE
ncbi:IAA-alanine resistance protein 1 [Gossypium australe]|uniref:IAA-alanine resistance protein 1 n=1 Tax=Gossypium australe TaxID=47621 RepID=A0A5B6V0S0_9ROSI|nr:IAA-alanine resistance protein 1 [Gossypium australe]